MVAGNRLGTHFNKVGWANLKTKFLKETGLNYESKQSKNKWEAMKREWELWVKLNGKETGLGWDPIKKTIQENPDVAKFREEGPKHLDEMEFLFEDVVAIGVGAWAPSEDINDSYNDRYNDEDNAVLKQLPGLEVGSDIFFIATRLMAKRSNREIFMGLEDSALQLGWLKTHSLADVSGS
ncbi:L10-interacting MYB domain-containing protein-like [Arachis ipaensis]|uniref:L10-interacting MYB domain-containing protein-like n=1 Tax=Arachis ipaensis TaxID=130454 RepID=UPI000A2AF271|nr:L10-interacting MYB domain-containing protein-like [Arachis ipaensis]